MIRPSKHHKLKPLGDYKIAFFSEIFHQIPEKFGKKDPLVFPGLNSMTNTSEMYHYIIINILLLD